MTIYRNQVYLLGVAEDYHHHHSIDSRVIGDTNLAISFALSITFMCDLCMPTQRDNKSLPSLSHLPKSAPKKV